jgi:hypothetical protein
MTNIEIVSVPIYHYQDKGYDRLGRTKTVLESTN